MPSLLKVMTIIPFWDVVSNILHNTVVRTIARVLGASSVLRFRVMKKERTALSNNW